MALNVDDLGRAVAALDAVLGPFTAARQALEDSRDAEVQARNTRAATTQRLEQAQRDLDRLGKERERVEHDFAERRRQIEVETAKLQAAVTELLGQRDQVRGQRNTEQQLLAKDLEQRRGRVNDAQRRAEAEIAAIEADLVTRRQMADTERHAIDADLIRRREELAALTQQRGRIRVELERLASQVG